MKRRSATDPTLLGQGTRVRLKKLSNQAILRCGVHLGVALGDDMKRKTAVAVLDGSCFWGRTQNFFHDCCTKVGIALASDCLVDNRRGDVVLHHHASGSDAGVAADAVEDGVPQVLAAKLKDGFHFFTRGRSKRMLCFRGETQRRCQRKSSLVDGHDVGDSDVVVVVVVERHGVFDVGARHGGADQRCSKSMVDCDSSK